MTRSGSSKKGRGLPFKRLRKRWKDQQDELRDEFQRELDKVRHDDVVAKTRIKLIYRKRGLNI